jgi:hypothetical protein
MRNSLRALLAVALFIAMTSASAFAQGGSATTIITGTIVDSSGAVLPGASVVAKNNATAEELVGVTNEQGQFTIPAVQAGTYTVTVTMPNFKTFVASDVRVSAGVPYSLKATMEVGGLNETVTVASGTEIIQTQSAAVSTTIDANQILKLPTGSRSALEFVTTLPGVNSPGGSRDSTVNGLPQSAINITIDGISANDNHLKTGDGFFARVSPRLDAMEEVTLSSAAQDAANTGQGAVQIRFTTRSGSNNYTGSSYYYLQHYKLNANTWFNNRAGTPKGEDILHQPGTRFGGPIVIPGVWNGRNKAFFFVNYEQSRAPGQSAENRTVLHPLAQQGIFRYLDANNQVRQINVLQHAANNGLVSSIDPTVARLLSDIRNAVAGAEVDLPDPSLQEYRFQFDTKNVTKYPTGRLDFNLTDKHRLSGSVNYTDLNSNPDTTNDREPRFPGFPGYGSQPSQRYTVQTNLRSTLSQNLVNEFKIGGSGGATKFSPEISAAQYTGTSVANQEGYSLNISGDLGITNVHTGPTYSAREATTRILENTLSYLKGTHNIQAGFAYTRAQVWLQNQQFVPTINFGIDANDPAQQIFSANALAALGGATLTNAQLADARSLFAVLTGRITSINGELRLDENTDEYVYLGLGMQRARLEDYGFFIADTWRWKPNFTLNLGLRYELQRPFFPINNSYSKATIDEVCGVSGPASAGSCNLFQNGNQPGKLPQFHQYNEGEGAYNTDANNWAPNVGFAWTMGGKEGILGSLAGKSEGDSVIRAGYTLGYNRPGMSDFTGNIDDNPGVSQTANRNHTIGNLGTPGSILFRNRGDLGPPPNLPVTRNYPMTDVVTGDILMFEPNLQVPYSQTWTAGWQRKLTNDFAFEARYVGSRSDQSWINYDYNETNLLENGILNEFKLAQANLQSHVAAGCGTTGQPSCSMAYRGPGTNPLPIALAYLNGRTNASDTAAYTGNNWTSTTFLNPLQKLNPSVGGWAGALSSDAGRRNNALTAGLPANFMVTNPHLLGGAEVVGNGGGTRYHSLQLELRKRLSHGLQFNANYVFGQAKILQSDSFRSGWVAVKDGGTEGGVDHAFKANWTYELPFGQGRRWMSNASGLMDRLVGGWSFDGVARIQSGRLFTMQGVRLVGMSEADLQKAFKIRFDHDAKLAWSLPQDIIDNTIRAFSVSPTTASGYTGEAPTGRYMAPGQGPDCISVIDNINECTPDQITLTSPTLWDFDLSAVKRTTIKGRVNFEFRAEFLNAFNHPWFTPVLTTSTNINNYRVTGASGSRTMQLVFRVNY